MFDLLMTPFLQIIDIFGNLRRHVFGPRASTQRKMNLSFKAGHFDISDSYTDMTRIFFFTLFYCSLFPVGFFFASAIFTLAYWIDKFTILRRSAQGGRIGSGVSTSSNTFLLLCVIAHAIMSSVNYAQFPFDNACESENAVDEEYYGSWKVGSETVQVSDESVQYNYCDQNLLRTPEFPPLPSAILKDAGSWMDKSQENFANVYAWVMIVVVCITGATIVIRTLTLALNALFFRKFKVREIFECHLSVPIFLVRHNSDHYTYSAFNRYFKSKI